MIKTLIIEDEFSAREALKKMLSFINLNIDIVGETGYISEAIDLIDEKQPDLIFLDIELEDGNAFDLLKKLNFSNFKIIFSTAYDQYAIKAFKYSTIDYLLKPIDPSDLKFAVEKATNEITLAKDYFKALEVLQVNMSEKNTKIVLKTTEQRYVVNLKDIIRLEADGAYTLFVTTEKKIIVSKNIKFYQELLDDRFIRCHKSHLVNIAFVKGFIKNEFLVLTNEELVIVSIRKRNEITKILNNL